MKNIKSYTQFSLNEQDYIPESTFIPQAESKNILLKDLLRAGGIREVPFSAFMETMEYTGTLETDGGQTVWLDELPSRRDSIGFSGSNDEYFDFDKRDNEEMQIDPATGGFIARDRHTGRSVIVTTDSGFKNAEDATMFFEVHDIDMTAPLRAVLQRMERSYDLFGEE